jgi:hypothetical protein
LVTGRRRVNDFGVCCWVAGSVAVDVGVGGHGFFGFWSDGLIEVCFRCYGWLRMVVVDG